MSELMVIENLNAVEIFKAGGAQPIIDKIREKATSEVFDVNTKKGRDSIRSMASDVAKSKTALDGLGKALTDRLNAQKAPIMNERNLFKAELDKIRDEVRLPLTEYEEAKQLRIDQIKQKIECMSPALTADSSSDDVRVALATLKSTVVNEESFAEFEAMALHVKEESVGGIETLLSERIKYEAEQAELQRHREDQAKREKQAKEDRIRQEAADQARKEEERARLNAEAEKKAAEQKLIDERERSEREAKDAADKVEADKKAAAEKAEEDKQAAINAERHRVEAERIQEQERDRLAEQAKQKAAAGKVHQRKINREALDCLVTGGIDEKEAREIVTWIAQGMIKNVTINY